MSSLLFRLSCVAVVALGLTGCADDFSSMLAKRSAAPIPEKTRALMAEKDMTTNAPILIRSFKKESELEIWKQTRSGDYALLKTYPICRWSGQLGPKTREGDRQAPEGFYTITPASLNPNSQLYLSFDMNYPNAYDRAFGRTGAYLMVHGACSSAGCYSMSDEQMMEIYALLRESFSGGQTTVQMQALPFRMTAENLARHRLDPNISFWRNLKEGTDRFDVTKQPARIGVCGMRYVFDAKPKDPMARLDPQQPCPAFETNEATAALVSEKARTDDAEIAALVAAGTPAVKLVYRDGSQNESFRKALESKSLPENRLYGASAGDYRFISRPEALLAPPEEIVLDGPKVTGSTPASAAKTATTTPAAKSAVAAPPAKTASSRPAPAPAVVLPAKPATTKSML